MRRAVLRVASLSLFVLGGALVAPSAAQINWSQRSDGISPRSNYALTYDAARGVTVLFGGAPFSGSPLADTWEYDGLGWTRRTPLTVPPGRQGAAMAFDSRRNLCVMFGGYGASGALRDTWGWNGADWTLLATSGPEARTQPALAYDQGRDRVVLFGGSRDGASQNLLGDHWEWDGALWTRVPPGGAPSARLGAALAYDVQRQVLVLAAGFGLGAGGVVPLDDCFEWDPQSNSWVGGALLPGGIRAPAMAYDALQGGVLLLGSFGGMTSSLLRYDGQSWTLLASPNVPNLMMGFGLAFDIARDRLVSFGGTNILLLLDATWEWDRTDWLRVGGGPPGSAGFRMVYDTALRVPLLFSPRTGTTVSRWNGRGWTDIASGAPGYIETSYAYDRVRGETVRYGGLDFARLSSTDETWIFDGAAWRQSFPVHKPGALLGAGLAFDEARGVVLLFGGMFAGVGLSDQTWQWDGVDWTQLSPATRPTPRIKPGLAYDKKRSRIVLFGGVPQLRDHWEWDGSNWIAITPAQLPPLGQSPALAYDDARERLVAFGLGANSDEHWEWDGVTWRRRTPAQLPTPRMEAAMAFDETRRCLVLYGGQLSSVGQIYSDTWELRTNAEAAYAEIGAGCGTPQARLASELGARPWIGESFSLEVAPLPSNTLAALMLFGTSNTQWSAIPLPLDFGPLGAAGCLLHVSIEAQAPLQLVGARALQSTNIPVAPELLGRTLYQQALLLAPGSNPLGIVLSSARAATIGAR
ncbi:MAG: hypothetical protein JNM84_08160 [Planctomycetes bacterium]|nr:hypothetical protein [Planctomycetota bacterium]